MGAVGGVLRATSGPPKFSTISSVKNPQIAAANNGLLNEFGTASAGENEALGNYITRYMANQPAAEKATGQEVGSINQFYDGSMSNQLAQLRAGRQKAVTDAANVASQQALASQNRSRVAGQGGGASSYDKRMAMAALTPIRTQAALDNANQERSDLGYVTQNQLGLTGQRNALNEKQAAASSGLTPQAQRLAALKDQTGVLTGMANVDQQNTFYGLQKQPNMWADIADSLDQGVLNGLAAYSSMGGGMGGMSRGGKVKGPGTETSDSIPVRLSKDEYVMPAEVVHMTGVLPLLERIRKIALKHREERMLYGHLKDHHTMHRGMHPVHGKAMDERMKNMKTAHVSAVERASGGMGKYANGGQVRGYADGGPITDEDFGFGDSGGGMKKSKGGGGGGGGLAGSAQQLGDRAMADLTPQWMPPTIIGQGGGMQPSAMTTGTGTNAAAPRIAPQSMPGSGSSNSQGPYLNMSNWDQVPDEWKAYAKDRASYYNDKNSPGYIAPGQYE